MSPTTRRAASPPKLVLTGPPDRLVGTVSVANTGDKVLAVSGARIVPDRLPEVAAQLAAVIAPGSTDTVGVAAALDPATAPGKYAASLEVHGQSRDVVLLVEATPSMTVRPTRLYLSPGRSEVSLQVTNTGNVPVPIAGSVAGTAVVVVAGDVQQGPDVTMTFATKPGTVGTGTTRELAAVVDVPDELDPRRRHVALLPVGLVDVRVIVLPRDAKPQAPDRASRSTSTRSTSTRSTSARSTSARSTSARSAGDGAATPKEQS